MREGVEETAVDVVGAGVVVVVRTGVVVQENTVVVGSADEDELLAAVGLHVADVWQYLPTWHAWQEPVPHLGLYMPASQAVHGWGPAVPLAAYPHLHRHPSTDTPPQRLILPPDPCPAFI